MQRAGGQSFSMGIVAGLPDQTPTTPTPSPLRSVRLAHPSSETVLVCVDVR
jgi:hypothetical protein